jgi:prolyl oligopeptidase
MLANGPLTGTLAGMKISALAALGLLLPLAALAGDAVADPNLWLEDITGPKALEWVRSQNAVAKREIGSLPAFEQIRSRLLAVYNSNDRIPYVDKHGAYYYNLWLDAQHPRGLWRRTTLEEYRKKDPSWETVLDLDALSAAERENWFWHGAQFVYPGYDRALIVLSRGGGDSEVVREFDVTSKDFVGGGFALPEAKSEVSWRDRDSVYVGTDFGAGSLTDSGYPRSVRLWRRGTLLEEAPVVYEGRKGDVAVEAWVSQEPGFHREFVERLITTFSSEHFLVEAGKLVKIDVPDDALVGTFRDQILVTLRTDWTVGGKTYLSGALLAAGWDAFLKGGRDFAVLFQPRPRVALASTSSTRHHLIVNELDNVRNRLFVLTLGTDGAWTRKPMPAPEFGTVSADGVEPESDDYFLSVTDFLTPSSFYLGSADGGGRELLKQLPSFFSSEGLEVSQHEAVSRDGTRVPYFQVSRKGIPADGSNPTLMYGYGGFEVSMTPTYSAGIGASWLERGGVYVLANIRGGGEFGPAWHQAALKENRQRAYDDFIAVGEDLVGRKVTSPRRLGIMGGSNGGLLMGVMITQRPDLFGAVVCESPLLDMRRYSHLLAGASWMGEYGDPDDPAQWAYISRYSPYQNAREGVKYPRILITTSTRDDRVHPGHARKMAARLEAQHHDVLYYENIEGGHAAAANNEERAYMTALAFAFLQRELM